MTETFWDQDIADLNLTDAEKNGLQVYRNYTRAFDDHAEKRFAQQIDIEEFGDTQLSLVLSLIVSDDPRFLPVVACAFADDQLRLQFKNLVPDSVVGDRSALLGPHGPFADLFKRIQLAHIFGVISSDLAVDLDHLRTIRNKISHSWDMETLREFYTRGSATKMFPIETLLHERPNWYANVPHKIEPVRAFRIRVIWITARLAYEAPLYFRARQTRLLPEQALYGPSHPKRLGSISKLAMDACLKVLA